MQRLIHEIRAKRPALARRADAGSRLAAVKLFCIECSGGSGAVAASCTVSDCPLWSAAGGAWSTRRRRSRLSGAETRKKRAAPDR